MPKGWIDPGEKVAETAVREVREEAGVNAEVVKKLGDIKYWYVRRESGERDMVAAALTAVAEGR